MKIYLFPFLLGLAFLETIEIPLYGSNLGFGSDYFYLDVSSLKDGETINLHVYYYYFYDYYDAQLEHKSSDSYSDDDFSDGFTTLYPYNYTNDSYKEEYDFYFSLTNYSNIYSYLLLKTNLGRHKVVHISHIKPKAPKANYSWVIWLVSGIITAICLIVFIILFLIKITTANEVSGISHQPAVNAYKPPVDY